MPRPRTMLALLMGMTAGVAGAQPAAPLPSSLPPMPPLQPPGALAQPSDSKPRPVDQAVADVDLLSTSLLVVEPGLGEDTGFANVYTVPGRPDLLMRRSGAVIAVFPRSEYVGIRGQIRPQIPAGTTFYIGQLPESLTGIDPAATGEAVHPATERRPGPGLRPASNRVEDGAAPTSAPQLRALPPDPALAEQAKTDEPPTIWTNERYRQRRLAQILEAARTSR